MREDKPWHMIATTALHQLGDISRPEGDLALINREEEDYYVGGWVTGYGFFNVKFPKNTTRFLTDEEVESYNERWLEAPWGAFKLNVLKKE